MQNRVQKFIRHLVCMHAHTLVFLAWIAMESSALGQIRLTAADAILVDSDMEVIRKPVPQAQGNLYGDGRLWRASGYPDPDAPGAIDVPAAHHGLVSIWTYAQEDQFPGVEAGAMYVQYILTGEAEGDRFGATLSARRDENGDVNGNGASNLVIGAPNAREGRGAVYVFCAIAGEHVMELEGEFPGDHFGSSVRMLGDITGNGCAEFLVGAPGHDEAGENSGRVYVFEGCTGQIVATIDGPAAGARFGVYVSGFVVGEGQEDPDVFVGPAISWSIHVSSDPENGEELAAEYVYHGEFDEFDPIAPHPRGMEDQARAGRDYSELFAAMVRFPVDFDALAHALSSFDDNGVMRFGDRAGDVDCMVFQDPCLSAHCVRMRTARLLRDQELRLIEAMKAMASRTRQREWDRCNDRHQQDLDTAARNFDNCVDAAAGTGIVGIVLLFCPPPLPLSGAVCFVGATVMGAGCQPQREADEAAAEVARVACVTGANAAYSSQISQLEQLEEAANAAFDREECLADRELRDCIRRQNPDHGDGLEIIGPPDEPEILDENPCP
ncbi:MAG: hypothetical protein EA379_04485 [Phycisphaerales bacterium]|nr:MAG: hypothetical protein EA379_04485 [Phycisphaerales bacterium]